MLNEVRLSNGIIMETPKKWLLVRKLPIIVSAIQMDKDFEVDTLEGTFQGKMGDYLLKGIKGELYPVKRNIFKETYEIIEN